MVKTTKAVRAARAFNQRNMDNWKAIVRPSDSWGATVTVKGLNGNFVRQVADMTVELDACFKIDGENLVLY